MESFTFGFAPLEDAALRTRGAQSSLLLVELFHSNVTDAGLRELLCATQVMHLDVSYSHVTIEGLKSVRVLPKLLELDVVGLGIGQEQFKELRKIMPDVVIFVKAPDSFEDRLRIENEQRRHQSPSAYAIPEPPTSGR